MDHERSGPRSCVHPETGCDFQCDSLGNCSRRVQLFLWLTELEEVDSQQADYTRRDTGKTADRYLLSDEVLGQRDIARSVGE